MYVPLGDENLLSDLHDSTQECNMRNVEAAEETDEQLITLHGYNMLKKAGMGQETGFSLLKKCFQVTGLVFTPRVW